jgi:hypothetical protein
MKDFMKGWWEVTRDSWRRPLIPWMRPMRQMTVALLIMLVGGVLAFANEPLGTIGLIWECVGIYLCQDARGDWFKWRAEQADRNFEEARMFIFRHKCSCLHIHCPHPRWMTTEYEADSDEVQRHARN